MKQNYLLLGEKEKLSINIIIVRKKFKIEDLKISSNTFINRLIFSLKIIRKSIGCSNKEIFYSRSIISALFLAFKNKNIILEIHHELKGFSKVLFNFSKKI